ncbi:MAG: small ribosomal subunit Rsm22 family protein [Halobacteriales archaeon]
MTSSQRESIRENAQYLRHVRPIDPEEITEYVEGRPHPGVVRETLRDLAVELALRERPDGTFVPVPEDPLDPDFDGVDRFPDIYADRFVDQLIDRYGVEWQQGESGDRLRDTIRRLKEAYFRQRCVEYDLDAVYGYGIYHLPDYYAVIQYVLAELAERSLLPRTARVLDVGAGVGGPALGLADFYAGETSVEYHAVEPSPAVELLTDLLAATGRNFRPSIHDTTAEAFDPATTGPYDLILFANVLSELADSTAVVERYAQTLTDDGSLIAIAPADRNTSIQLREVERSVIDEGLTVFAPTVRFWPDHSPTATCWSFDVKPELEVPTFQRELDAAGGNTGEFCNVDVQFSYSILRSDGRRQHDFTLDPDRFAKFAEMDRHVTERIDCVACKLSHDLGSDHPVYRISDGSESTAHFAVLTRETSLNRSLRTADYGAVLRFESVLVLWNDDEAAYNLVVDDETIVDLIAE